MVIEAKPEVKVRPAVFPADKDIVSELFLAYAKSLPVKLDFQGFEQELANLPGKYAEEKGGDVFLAYTSAFSQSADSKENVVGVVALRAFPTSDSIATCELKRLYLTPASRGLGLSKILMQAVLERARKLEYKVMFLDTLRSMTTARKLYESHGFVETEPYYASVPDAVYYKLCL